VARRPDDGKALDAVRIWTANANSFLYGRVERIAVLTASSRVVTHRLGGAGPSLRAAGARVAGTLRPKVRRVPSRPRESPQVYGKDKMTWEL
jgi:hypothetical protein